MVDVTVVVTVGSDEEVMMLALAIAASVNAATRDWKYIIESRGRDSYETSDRSVAEVNSLGAR